MRKKSLPDGLIELGCALYLAKKKLAGAFLQNGFGVDLELFAVRTRREEGAYSLKSVTDEQQRPDRNQPEDAPKSILKTRPS